MRQLGLDDVFDVVVSSSELGVAKPDPQAIEPACRQLGAEPSQCSFVDDTPANVETAARLGLRAHLFTRSDRLAGFLLTGGAGGDL